MKTEKDMLMEEKKEQMDTNISRYELYLSILQVSKTCGKYGLLMGMLALLILEILTMF